jgi:hypothetical protein
VGGGSIQALGASRVRVATAAAALVLAGGVAIAAAVAGDGPRVGWLWALASAGVVATAIALLGWAGAVWWAVLALGAEYTVLRVGRPVDIGAAYVAMALVLLAELVLWSLGARSRVVEEAEATRRRLVHLSVVGLGTLVIGSLIVSAGRFGAGPALTRTLAGVLCAIAILAVVAWVSPARPRRRSSTTDRDVPAG